MLLIGYFIYLQQLYGVDLKTVEYYQELRAEVIEAGYQPMWFVLSTVRPYWFNQFLVETGRGAARRSQHLYGKAIDLVVLDVNLDGQINSTDVDIVYSILDKKVVKNKGGIGTYKSQPNFLDYQQVHFDSRGHRARWAR